MSEIITFRDFGLADNILQAVEIMGFQVPTPVQSQAIPLIEQGKDLIACAQTGTGKTAAYIIPVMNHIIKDKLPGISTVILAPTRELAMQIDQQVEGLGYFANISSRAIYGGGDGMAWDMQKKALGAADIIVATPGRLIAQLNQGNVKLDHIKYLILDEADRMLDMGFFEDIMKIVNQLPRDRISLLFSATMPHGIRKLAQSILKNPEEVSIAVSTTAEGVKQVAYLAYDNQKMLILKKLILENKDQFPSVLMFASTKSKVKDLEKDFRKAGMDAYGIHSDLLQDEREKVLRNFRNGQFQVLIATDIMSRGIDIVEIRMVVNYDVPQDPEDYIHRVGRTARAEREGIALTFVDDSDRRKFYSIESLLNTEISIFPPPNGMGEGPRYDRNFFKDHKKRKPFHRKKSRHHGKQEHKRK
ncbi:DEAD/DEAH box helicase [Bacteroidota bacterium]